MASRCPCYAEQNERGSSEIEVNEFAVKPLGLPYSSMHVTITTPATNWPRQAPEAQRIEDFSKHCLFSS
jgi:hypothetical protein